MLVYTYNIMAGESTPLFISFIYMDSAQGKISFNDAKV